MNNLNLVETTVVVAGQKVHFVHMKLHQQFYQHHRCEILLDHDAFGDKKWMIDPVKIFKYIGESLFITMTHKESGDTNVFSGIVSNISFIGENGAQNYILVEGVSDTIKLAAKPTMDSFVDKTLEQIVTEAVTTSGNGAKVTVQPEYKNPISYIVQYNESCFDFLNRLCLLYGESFWNDGSTTYWGKPDLGDTITLTYEVEMTGYSLKGSLLPPTIQNYEYLVSDDEERTKETRTNIPEAAGYLKPILDKADSIYKSLATSPLDALVSDTDSILKMVDIERTRTVANMLIMSASTQTCKVGLGKVVTVQFPSYMEIDTSAGAFIITEINHVVDQQGHYSNTFSGTRAALGYIPMPQNIPMPIARPERAIVVSNADPKNKGRIKVKHLWQNLKSKETNWLRVLSPDAGGSDKVASNRGLVTIPEVGDTVMINFEYGDPNRPYSTGSLFTSKNGGGGGQGNKTKSLTTRSGNTITLDDDEGSVLIADQTGNDSVMIDGKGNISITSTSSIQLSTGESSIAMKSDGTIDIQGKVVTINGSTSAVLASSAASFSATADGNLANMSGETTTVHGSKTTTVSGQIKTTVTATGQTVIDGAIVKLN